MSSVALSIQGGGRLEVFGPPTANRILVILHREQLVRDDRLVARLVAALADEGVAVMRYEPGLAVTTRLIDHPRFHALPSPLRTLVKALRLLAHPRHWRHFSPRYRAVCNALPYRAQALRELAALLGPDKEIIFLARSASARVATLMADDAGINRLVCLGYPFQHPDEPADPARYAHLASLRTPCLMLQGRLDPYGNPTLVQPAWLAPGTRLAWIDTDHSFDVPAAEWTRLVGMIRDFIRHPALRAAS